MNLNYAKGVKGDIDQLLEAGFIAGVKEASWLSLIVVVSKKYDKLQIYVDYRKLNKEGSLSLSFTNDVLDKVASHKMYFFMGRWSQYNLIGVYPLDKHKISFIS